MDSQLRQWAVLKFGGTSVATLAGWQQITQRCEELLQQDQHVLVVVSARSGVTDQLSLLSKLHPEERANQCHSVVDAYTELSNMLGVSLPQSFAESAEKFYRHAAADFDTAPAQHAAFMSYGEIFMTLVGAEFLQQNLGEICLQNACELLQVVEDEGKDVANYLMSHCEPTPDAACSGKLAAQGKVHLTQGFMAGNSAGETCLLGRGGSDTSAAYLAAQLDADRLEIWTDVPGLFSADPRLLSGARLLRHVSYREAQELASMGAKVLHPRCISPARKHNIPIFVRQTSRPDITGTEISEHSRDFGAQVKAVVHRKGITLISLEGIDMWHQVGFLARCFTVFSNHGFSIDLISTSEANVTVSLDMDSHALAPGALDGLVNDLEQVCRVKVISNCASVSLVGLGIRTIMHKLGPALEVFEQRQIHLVSQAANDLNLSFVVDERDADRLVMQLHQQLIPGGVGGDSVFGPTWDQLFRKTMPKPAREPWWKNQRQRLLSQLGETSSAYVYYLPAFRQAAKRLANMQHVNRALYAIKANAHTALISAAAEEGLGFECVSPQEVQRVKESVPDVDPKRILFTPNFAGQSEYAWAIEQGINLTIDNVFVLERWGAELAGQEVFLRMDPGSGLGHHKMVRTAGSNSKFGIPAQRLDDVHALLSQHNIRVTGLHAHTGSGIMHPDNWQRTLAVLADMAQGFDHLKVIDVGGGLGVPDRSDELPFDLNALDARLGELQSQLNLDVDIWLEPGRYLSSQCGVLLSTVTQTKGKGEAQYLGISTGMNSLIRPTLYGAYHEIFNLTQLDQDPTQVYSVVGPICETGDVLGLDRLLPVSEPGDVILIANAGAYGAVMASNYNLRSPAVEIVLDD